MEKIIKLNTEEATLQNVIEQAEQSKESLSLSEASLQNVIDHAEHSKLVNLTTLHDATNLALTDPLTQLPNRILFNDSLEKAT